MSDKTLLELAAKAAGLDANLEIDGTFSIWNDKVECTQSVWNPLIDDGDALILAVKLGLQMYFFLPNDDIGVAYTEVGRSVKERHGDDPYAATRRAIVRAAAEIGRTV